MNKQFKKITEEKTYSSTLYSKSKEGTIRMKYKKLLQQGTKYI